MCTASSEAFCFGFDFPLKMLSICRALNFCTSLCVHLKKMGHKLLYIYLYLEETSIPLYVCIQNFQYNCFSVKSAVSIHLRLRSQNNICYKVTTSVP